MDVVCCEANDDGDTLAASPGSGAPGDALCFLELVL